MEWRVKANPPYGEQPGYDDPVCLIALPLFGKSLLLEDQGRFGSECTMKALILYVVFVATGAVVAALIGYYVEINVSPAASLIVFLSLFFANFAVSWIVVILIMDGSLKDAQGRQAQIEIERARRI